MARSDNLNTGVSPDMPICSAAHRAVEFHTQQVLHLLWSVGRESNIDAEVVHELRVATRRAAAAIRIFEAVLPRRKSDRLKACMRKIRRAAGKVRNIDLVAEQLSGSRAPGFRAAVSKIGIRRDEALGALRTVYQRLNDNSRFDRRVQKLLRGVHWSARKNHTQPQPTFRTWAHTCLRRTFRKLLRAVPVDCEDTGALHRFRICAKKLRYKAEILGPAFPPVLVEGLLPMVATLQRRLGKINDHVTILKYLRGWVNEARTPAEASFLGTIEQRERSRMKRARKKFANWWTQGQSDALYAYFNELLPNQADVASKQKRQEVF